MVRIVVCGNAFGVGLSIGVEVRLLVGAYFALGVALRLALAFALAPEGVVIDR